MTEAACEAVQSEKTAPRDSARVSYGDQGRFMTCEKEEIAQVVTCSRVPYASGSKSSRIEPSVQCSDIRGHCLAVLVCGSEKNKSARSASTQAYFAANCMHDRSTPNDVSLQSAARTQGGAVPVACASCLV